MTGVQTCALPICTAVSPVHIAERLTQIFGPVGLGWGFEVRDIHYIPVEKPEVVYVSVEVWWKLDGVTNKGDPNGRASFQHVGGGMLQKGGKNGIRYDDEAVKGAVTDAIGKAFTYLGAAADIHLGLFDDVKYLRAAEAAFADEGKAAPQTPETEGAEDKKAAAAAEVETWQKNILAQIEGLPVELESMTLLKGVREGAKAMFAKLGEEHPAVAAVRSALIAKREKITAAAAGE